MLKSPEKFAQELADIVPKTYNYPEARISRNVTVEFYPPKGVVVGLRVGLAENTLSVTHAENLANELLKAVEFAKKVKELNNENT